MVKLEAEVVASCKPDFYCGYVDDDFSERERPTRSDIRKNNQMPSYCLLHCRGKLEAFLDTA